MSSITELIRPRKGTLSPATTVAIAEFGLEELLQSMPDGSPPSARAGGRSRRAFALPVDDRHYVQIPRELLDELLDVLRERFPEIERDEPEIVARHAAEAGLAAEAVAAVIAGRNSEAAMAEYRKRRDELLAVRRSLTEFRLSWEALAAALGGRAKVIVDADRVPGRRQLLLFDPAPAMPPILVRPDREQRPPEDR